MKKLLSLSLFILLFGNINFAQTSAGADTLVWHTDIMKAQELSAATGKPIFALFTGSDWCVWCHKLERDVFKKADFVAWAKKNVILLELDFPRNKQLPPALAQQNQGLQQTFQVKGYPTVWLFFLKKNEETKKMDIAALGSLGYPQGAELGKEQVKFISDANNIIAQGILK